MSGWGYLCAGVAWLGRGSLDPTAHWGARVLSVTGRLRGGRGGRELEAVGQPGTHEVWCKKGHVIVVNPLLE